MEILKQEVVSVFSPRPVKRFFLRRATAGLKLDSIYQRGGPVQARSLLQNLKDSIETQSQIAETETRVTPISGDIREAAATVLVPIEGQIKVFEIRAREVGTYEGLD